MTTSTPLVVRRQGVNLVGELWPGRAPLVVLLHAGVTDRRSWREAADVLAGATTLLAYDRRGFGDTASSSTPFSHLEDLLAVLDEVADAPAWLVGCSMGGEVALDAALSSPERVAGLVLIAPAVSGAPDFELDPVTARFDHLLEDAYAAGDLDEVNRLETWLWLDGRAQPEGRVGGPARSLALEMNAIVLRNAVPENVGASGLDAWSRLETIAAPTTVACGALDVPFLVERSRDLAARLPEARYVELPGVAHLSYLERPTVVAHLVKEAVGAQ